MTRPYAVGDTVFATQPLVSTRHRAGDISVEIPRASRGVISEVHHDNGLITFTVDFAVGTASVEVWVSPCQVVMMPPVPGADNAATTRHPHRLCRRLHPFIGILLLGAYILLAVMNPAALLVGAVVLGAGYAHQLWSYQTWLWVPQIFRYPTPCEDEELVIDEAWAKSAVLADGAFLLALASLILGHLAYLIDPTALNAMFFVVLLVVVAVFGVAHMYVHDKAARICPKND